MQTRNCYADELRADAYARLEFPGTYYLAFRDLPEIISECVTGRQALDFGCGTGRSSRFLKELGFETVGVDISAEMIEKACLLDPAGDYRLIKNARLGQFAGQSFDLILAAFTFDNIAMEDKLDNLLALRGLLKERGRLILLVSSPEIYYHEWVSFSTIAYPENMVARTGDRVKIIIKDIEDPRPVEDCICFDQDYKDLFSHAGLDAIKTHRPLGRIGEPYVWFNEMNIAPWSVYVLARK